MSRHAGGWPSHLAEHICSALSALLGGDTRKPHGGAGGSLPSWGSILQARKESLKPSGCLSVWERKIYQRLFWALFPINPRRWGIVCSCGLIKTDAAWSSRSSEPGMLLHGKCIPQRQQTGDWEDKLWKTVTLYTLLSPSVHEMAS